MSEDLKDILKCVLIWGTILIFASYLLADAEILGNVKQQERPETSVMIGAGSKLEKDFICQTSRLSGVELFLSTESASVTGTFRVTIYQDKEEIQSWQVNRLTISTGDTTYFRLDQRLSDCKDQKFRIVLDGAEGDTGVAAGVTGGENGIQILAYRSISRPFPKALVLMVIAAAAAVMLVIFTFLKKKKIRTEVLFAIVYLFMSISTLAAIPAFNSPDEYSHFLRSYEVSRGYLTSEGNGGNDLFSYGRTFDSGLIPDFSSKEHVSLWDIGGKINQHINTEKTQFYGFGNTALYAPTSYLPQAVGIRIADFFTDRPFVLAYGGRIANMLCFGLIFFLAIHFTPVGKNFIAFLGLVPINIQSANSMSADALQQKKGNEKMAAGTDVYTDRFSVPVQSCLYAILPSSVSHSEGKVSKQKKLLVSCGVCRCHDPDFEFWLACHCVQVSLRVSAGSGYGCPAYGDSEKSGGFCIYICAESGCVWNCLSYGNDGKQPWMVEYSGLQSSGGGIHLDLPAKVALGGVCVLVFGLTFVTLYGQWTAYGYDKILGVQGRYFLPLLLPLILALKPKKFAAGEDGTPWGLFLGAWSIDLCVYATLFVQALCQYR